MIFVTRLDDTEVVVNADLILTVERTPDTVLTMTTGARLMVKDSVKDVVDKAVDYRRRIGQGLTVRQGE